MLRTIGSSGPGTRRPSVQLPVPVSPGHVQDHAQTPAWPSYRQGKRFQKLLKGFRTLSSEKVPSGETIRVDKSKPRRKLRSWTLLELSPQSFTPTGLSALAEQGLTDKPGEKQYWLFLGCQHQDRPSAHSEPHSSPCPVPSLRSPVQRARLPLA